MAFLSNFERLSPLVYAPQMVTLWGCPLHLLLSQNVKSVSSHFSHSFSTVVPLPQLHHSVFLHGSPCFQSWCLMFNVKVNKNFAIKLVAEAPVSDVQDRVVSCDGGGGALGHPKVYINLVCHMLISKGRFFRGSELQILTWLFLILLCHQDKDTKVGTCGYCGLQFKQKHHHWNVPSIFAFLYKSPYWLINYILPIYLVTLNSIFFIWFIL